MNWELLTFRNILTVGVLAVVGVYVYNHFASKKDGN